MAAPLAASRASSRRLPLLAVLCAAAFAGPEPAAAASVAGEVCGTVPSLSGACGGLHDVLLLVHASAVVASDHGELTAALKAVVASYAFSNVDGATSDWSPRVGIISFNGGSSFTVAQSVTEVSALTSDAAALDAAIDARPTSEGQTCTSCALETAQSTFAATGRAAATKHVRLLPTQNHRPPLPAHMHKIAAG